MADTQLLQIGFPKWLSPQRCVHPLLSSHIACVSPPVRSYAITFRVTILKSKDITLPTKVRLVKAMVFPVVMYGCDSWTTKKAEHQKIDAFELWCWRRLLRLLGLQGDPTSPS